MSNANLNVSVENRYFEDYLAGSVYEFGSIAVEQDEVIAFARRFDPQAFHIDPESAKKTIYGGLIAARGMVTSFWPAADKIYEMIDFFQPPLGDGLKITNVKSGRAPEKNSDAILIGGDIINVSDDTKPVPTIRVSLFNADNEEVQFINVIPDVQQLMASKRYAFTSRLENPAPSARQIKVTFIKTPKGAAHAPAAPAPAARAPAAPAPAQMPAAH